MAHLSSASAQVRMSTLEATLAVAAILAIVAVGNAHLSAFLSNGGGSQQNAPPAAGGDEPSAPSSDALLNRGLEKRSATLTVTGAFQQVLAFLRSLERLETFVIISELDVKALGARRGAKDQPAMPEVSMGFKLTAYGRQPSQESDSGSDETQN